MLNYDKQNDMLYVSIADNSNSYGADEVKNITVFRDVDSDNVTGFMVFDFIRNFATQIERSDIESILEEIKKPLQHAV